MVQRSTRFILTMLALTAGGVLLLSVAWEFMAEEIILGFFIADFESESTYERLEYIVTSMAFACLAMVVPGWLTIRISAEREQLISNLRLTEKELQKSEQELRALSSRMLTGQEQERQRVASDLHDNIVQSLCALKFMLERNLTRMDGGESSKSVELQSTFIPFLEDAIKQVRRIYMELRPSMLDDLGIVPAINWLCREFQENYPDIRIATQIDANESHIPVQLKIVVFRILQERMHDVGIHNEADNLRVSLFEEDCALVLGIADDGKDLDTGNMVSPEHTDRGTGLSNMKGRVELSGGRFHLEADGRAGNLVTASWDLTGEADRRMNV